jgi:chaperone required for assembly of F1-ATPase
MKRFWKAVTVEREGDGFALQLDGRPVKTPGRAPLALPSEALAEAVADEWRAVGETIDPRAMPLTGLGNAAIDRVGAAHAAFAAGLAAYGETDLLYYRADGPAELVERQAAAWDPLLAWARTRYDVHFETATGVMHHPQPPATVARLAEAVAALDPFRLAGLSPVVTIGGSLIAALALLEGHAGADAIWRAVETDEDWQTEQWGDDDIAIKARETRKADFDAGARFLSLL